MAFQGSGNPPVNPQWQNPGGWNAYSGAGQPDQPFFHPQPPLPTYVTGAGEFRRVGNTGGSARPAWTPQIGQKRAFHFIHGEENDLIKPHVFTTTGISRMPPLSSAISMVSYHRIPSYMGGFSHNGPPHYPPDGGGFRSNGGGDGGNCFGSMPYAGKRRDFSSSSRGGSPDNLAAAGYAKLYVASIPREAAEEDICPLFEEHGNVIEVYLMKDKKTGRRNGCCFIKYATTDEADRAIRALHNQYTLPGAVGPIQVKYADGERERLGGFKLFVGAVNRQANEKDIEEIFSSYGKLDDIYIMRDERQQSRGCGFVKFAYRDMAAAAINGLNGVYVMRGCDKPLIVRFADPKKPRTEESRSGSDFGPQSHGPFGLGPGGPGPSHVQPTGILPPEALQPMSPQNPSSQSNPRGFGSPMIATSRVTETLSATPMSPQSLGASLQSNPRGFSPMTATGRVPGTSSAVAGPLGGFGGPVNDPLPVPSVLPHSTVQQAAPLGTFGGPLNAPLLALSAEPISAVPQIINPPESQAQSVGQRGSSLPKQLQSPYQFPSINHQRSSAQSSLASFEPLGQLQPINSSGETLFNQALPLQQLLCPNGQLPLSQPQVQVSTSAVAGQQMPSRIQMQAASAAANQQLPPTPTVQRQMIQPQQQPLNQLNQMLPQQNQVLDTSFQSSQPAFSQLQQPLHMMQPFSQNLTQQQASQAAKLQPSDAVVPSTISSSPSVPEIMQAALLVCNWTEHISPEGCMYYYNSVTGESKWEKPERFISFEQLREMLKQHHAFTVQNLNSQQAAQAHPPVLPVQVAQTPQMQLQTKIPPAQIQLQTHIMPPPPPPLYSLAHPGVPGQHIQGLPEVQLQSTPSTVIDPARYQQGFQTAPGWMWYNKPAGT